MNYTSETTVSFCTICWQPQRKNGVVTYVSDRMHVFQEARLFYYHGMYTYSQ